ncbi:MAG: FKBP-type peptidyl-prolyl cis-trans isomerase [Lachnospiraceae bacterium]|nr:FKBP-type peptidyl-prolyl cis-trans isomerase [Lachnospiraceae bacterium]
MKNRVRIAAALLLATLLAGCDGLPVGNAGAYLKDFDPGKYVKLGDYMNLDISVAKPETNEAERNQYIVAGLSSLAKNDIGDREAKLGDTANIDYAGKMEDTGEYFEGGTAQGYDLLLGSGTFIPGFEDGVIGMRTGENRDIPLTFPENYGSKDLAGKKVIFEVTLNALKGPADADVQALGLAGVSTVDAYVDHLGREYDEQVESQYRSQVEEAIRNKVESNSTFKTPPTAFLNRLQASYREQVQILADAYSNAYGQTFTVSDLLGYAMSGQGYSGDEDSYVRDAAADSANAYLTAAAIAREQGISVDDEEVKSMMEENLAGSGFATIEEYMQASDLEEIREQILYDKVMDFLFDNNNITE